MHTKMMKASLAAFLVLAVLGYLAFGVFLSDAWIGLEVAGFLRPGQGAPISMVFWMVTLLIAAHLMGHLIVGFWFEKKKPKNLSHVAQHGLVVGIIYCLPQLSNYFFYNLPSIIPIVNILYALIAFPLAAIVFSKVYK